MRSQNRGGTTAHLFDSSLGPTITEPGPEQPHVCRDYDASAKAVVMAALMSLSPRQGARLRRFVAQCEVSVSNGCYHKCGKLENPSDRPCIDSYPFTFQHPPTPMGALYLYYYYLLDKPLFMKIHPSSDTGFLETGSFAFIYTPTMANADAKQPFWGLRGSKLQAVIWAEACINVMIFGYNQVSAGSVLNDYTFENQFPTIDALNAEGNKKKNNATILGKWRSI